MSRTWLSRGRDGIPLIVGDGYRRHFAGVVNGIACYPVANSGWALPASVRIAQVTNFLFCCCTCLVYVLPFRGVCCRSVEDEREQVRQFA